MRQLGVGGTFSKRGEPSRAIRCNHSPGCRTPEINAPQRPRHFLIAVTATDERDRRQPTSSSAADRRARCRTCLRSSNPWACLFRRGRGKRTPLVHSGAGTLHPTICRIIISPAVIWRQSMIRRSVERLTVGACTEKATLGGIAWNGCVAAGAPWRSVALEHDVRDVSAPNGRSSQMLSVKAAMSLQMEGHSTTSPDLCLVSTSFGLPRRVSCCHRPRPGYRSGRAYGRVTRADTQNTGRRPFVA